MADLATLQTRLAEAETAYHNLGLGKGVASVTGADGRAVTYTKADVGALAAYIASLKADIGTLEGTVARRAPILLGF